MLIINYTDQVKSIYDESFERVVVGNVIPMTNGAKSFFIKRSMILNIQAQMWKIIFMTNKSQI